MIIIKKSFLLIFSMSLLFIACKSKTGSVTDASATTNSYEDAIIRNYGDRSLDGCGWVVDVSSTIYMPTNLSAEFYEDGLPVRIKFEELARVNCGLVKDAHLSMRIEDIQKK